MKVIFSKDYTNHTAFTNKILFSLVTMDGYRIAEKNHTAKIKVIKVVLITVHVPKF